MNNNEYLDNTKCIKQSKSNKLKTPEIATSNLEKLNNLHLFDNNFLDVSNNLNINNNNNNYNTEVGGLNINKILNSIKCPLKKLSENIVIKDIKKLACKTSIELTTFKQRAKLSSKILYGKSEAYAEDKAQKLLDNDSEIESDLSDNSIEDPSKCDKAKNKFSNLIDKYYMGSADNISGNYDTYVTNCLKLISYFKKREYFEKLNIYNSVINDLNEKYYNDKCKLNNFTNILNKKISTNNGIQKQQNIYCLNCFNLSNSKLLLILDLDETLIHSDLDLKYSAHDKYIELNDGSVIPLNIRPYIKEFLDFCNQHFDIVIYTASCSDYADPILNFLEEHLENNYFKYRLYREHCIVYGNFYIKDLLIFNKPMEKTIIVDNNLFSFCHYLNNGVLVTSYYNENDDLDLLSLIEFFKSSIVNSKDVREEIANTFEFEKIQNSIKNINL